MNKQTTDIEQAVYLLREIEAFFSINTHPDKDDIRGIKEDIKFPLCWECGDNGIINDLGGKCENCN